MVPSREFTPLRPWVSRLPVGKLRSKTSRPCQRRLPQIRSSPRWERGSGGLVISPLAADDASGILEEEHEVHRVFAGASAASTTSGSLDRQAKRQKAILMVGCGANDAMSAQVARISSGRRRCLWPIALPGGLEASGPILGASWRDRFFLRCLRRDCRVPPTWR